jgi:DNA polymerase-3 subunit beta
MEFSVKKFDLLEELNLTQGVVERKTTIPILSNLLCEAQGNRLTITATDLELSIRTSCEAKVKKEGAGTIPAKKLLELVRGPRTGLCLILNIDACIMKRSANTR